jgi:hypothetical protein
VGAAVVAALALLRLAVLRHGEPLRRRGSVTLGVAAVLLALGVPGAVFAVSVPVTWHDAICGSALSASLERGRPDDSALDDAQAGCKARGAAVVHAATAAGSIAVGFAALAAMGAVVPPRRSPAYA